MIRKKPVGKHLLLACTKNRSLGLSWAELTFPSKFQELASGFVSSKIGYNTLCLKLITWYREVVHSNQNMNTPGHLNCGEA